MTETNGDFDLVKSFIDGDESAYNKIVLKYQQKIYWHARRMTGNHFDADEITQQVLIVLFEKLKGFKFQSSLYTWIYRITVTRSINFLKRRSLKELLSLEDKLPRTMKSNVDIVNDLEIKEKFGKLEKVLQKVSVKQREVFIMRSFDELSYEEISQITGKSVGGLKANYFHAVKKIMELMKEDE